VLLVGDATFDPRNFLQKGDFDFTPTKLIDAAQGETSSDGWFVDGDGDGLPELAIGASRRARPPQVQAVVQKTLDYAGKDDLGARLVRDRRR